MKTKTLKMWFVSRSLLTATSAPNDERSALTALRILRALPDMPSDLQLCTNECATIWEDGMKFRDGHFYDLNGMKIR